MCERVDIRTCVGDSIICMGMLGRRPKGAPAIMHGMNTTFTHNKKSTKSSGTCAQANNTEIPFREPSARHATAGHISRGQRVLCMPQIAELFVVDLIIQ